MTPSNIKKVHNSINISIIDKKLEIVSLCDLYKDNQDIRIIVTSEGKNFFKNSIPHLYPEISRTLSKKEKEVLLFNLGIDDDCLKKNNIKAITFDKISNLLYSLQSSKDFNFLIAENEEENRKISQEVGKIPSIKALVFDDKNSHIKKLDRLFDEKTFSMNAIILNNDQSIGKHVFVKTEKTAEKIADLCISSLIHETLKASKYKIPRSDLIQTPDRLYWIEERFPNSSFKVNLGFVQKDYLKNPLYINAEHYLFLKTGKASNYGSLEGYLLGIACLVQNHNIAMNTTNSDGFENVFKVMNSTKILDNLATNKVIKDLYTLMAFNLQIGATDMKPNNFFIEILKDDKINFAFTQNPKSKCFDTINSDDWLIGKTLNKISPKDLEGTHLEALAGSKNFHEAWDDSRILIRTLKEKIDSSTLKNDIKEKFKIFTHEKIESNTFKRDSELSYSINSLYPKNYSNYRL